MIPNHDNTEALLKELEGTGSPVDWTVLYPRHKSVPLELEQLGGPCDSRIFELENGQVAIMVYLAIANHSSRTIQVTDVELRGLPRDRYFSWLPVSETRNRGYGRNSSYRCYRFPGSGGLELPYDQVLNHVLLDERRLSGRRRAEGWLLGVGGLMPAALEQGKFRELEIAITTIGYGDYVKTLCLWTERLQSPRKLVKPKSCLFERADRVPDSTDPWLRGADEISGVGQP